MSLVDLPMPESETPPPVEDLAYDGYVDYFGFDDTERYFLPDGRQYIEFKPLTEGGRAKYEAATSRDIRFNRRTDDAAIKMDAGAERRALIEASVVGWSVARVRTIGNEKRWEPVPFSKGSPGSTLSQWLDQTNPRLVNELVREIRRANSWMAEDMTSEMIREEIKRLEEMLQQAEEREAKAKNS